VVLPLEQRTWPACSPRLSPPRPPAPRAPAPHPG